MKKNPTLGALVAAERITLQLPHSQPVARFYTGNLLSAKKTGQAQLLGMRFDVIPGGYGDAFIQSIKFRYKRKLLSKFHGNCRYFNSRLSQSVVGIHPVCGFQRIILNLAEFFVKCPGSGSTEVLVDGSCNFHLCDKQVSRLLAIGRSHFFILKLSSQSGHLRYCVGGRLALKLGQLLISRECRSSGRKDRQQATYQRLPIVEKLRESASFDHGSKLISRGIHVEGFAA